MENEHEAPHNMVVMWDMYGIEYVMDVTALEMNELFSVLQTGSKARNATRDWQYRLNSMMWRARANGQRHYEIYAVQASDGVTEADIREMFEHSPQQAAETIRRLGVKIFSDRAEADNNIVIR